MGKQAAITCRQLFQQDGWAGWVGRGGGNSIKM